MEDVCCSEKKEIKENEDMTIKLEVDIYGEKNIFLLKKEHKERARERERERVQRDAQRHRR